MKWALIIFYSESSCNKDDKNYLKSAAWKNPGTYQVDTILEVKKINRDFGGYD
ncbi:MAG: hypothetical protein ABI288_03955 [Ginsengibacter sp.]